MWLTRCISQQLKVRTGTATTAWSQIGLKSATRGVINMKRAVASLMCVLLVYPTGLITAAKLRRVETANELIKKSYLDLLELDQIQRFSSGEIKNVEEQLNKEKDAERARLEKDQERIE